MAVRQPRQPAVNPVNPLVYLVNLLVSLVNTCAFLLNKLNLFKSPSNNQIKMLPWDFLIFGAIQSFEF
jgi:hypothetical protein